MAAYTTIDNPELYFQAKTYSGNGSADHAITLDGDEDMQPDFVWQKRRNDTNYHVLYDSVRGATKYVYSNTNGAENTNANGLTAFGSNGFTLGNDGDANHSSGTHVAWCWKGGTTSGIAGSADITPNAYSFNQTSGFSIVTYNGTDVNGNTVLHGLGAVPQVIFVKRRVDSGYDWVVYHKNDVAGLYLNTDGNNNDSSNTNIWFNGNTPTSTQFHIGTDGRIGDNVSTGAFVAYCFAPKQGYSKFGSYEGNGNADGTFVYLGFRPAWLMVKPIDASDNWVNFDNKRLGFNSSVSPYSLHANKNFAETTDTGQLDFLSNGFKIRSSGNTVNRTSTFIYMAFAEQPFVNSNEVPANAR